MTSLKLSCLWRMPVDLDLVVRWCQAVRDSSRVLHLPLVLPYVIDLGAIIFFSSPPCLSSRYTGVLRNRRSPYCIKYQEEHLQRLAGHLDVKCVRQLVAKIKNNPKAQKEIIARFASLVFEWMAKAWLAQECAAGTAPQGENLAEFGASVRWITRPEEIKRFLIQMGGTLHQTNAFNRVLDPVERFLLGARARIEGAFKNKDLTLIRECLKSHELVEADFKLDPLFLAPQVPEVPSRNPGERSAIWRIRTTNDLEKLPEAIPQELALARREPNGNELLLHKLLNEGLLIWERHDYDTEIRREKYLVCFVADVGMHARVMDRRETLHTTSEIHARRLIFEFLRDMVTHIHLPDVQIDLRVFLEPVDDKRSQSLRWTLSLEELRTSFGHAQYSDMVELETRAPGYYFHERFVQKAEQIGHQRFIQGVFDSCDYDLTLFVFLAPDATIHSLMPFDPPPPRKEPGVKDIVKLVQLGRWPGAIEMAHGESFDDIVMQPEFNLSSDEELRYSLLEDLLGQRGDDTWRSTDIELNT